MGFISSILRFIGEVALELVRDEQADQTETRAHDEYADQDYYDPARDSLAHGVDVNGVTMDHDWHEGTRD